MNVTVMLIAATVIVSAAAQMCTDPRVSRRFEQKRKLSITVYGLYGALGVAALIAFIPR